MHKTLAEAQSVARQIHPQEVEELVADKGYATEALEEGGLPDPDTSPAR